MMIKNSQTVWLRLIAPLSIAGIGAILGLIIGTFAFPVIGTLAGALIGGSFGMGSGLFIVGLELFFSEKIVSATLSTTLGGAVMGASLGALIGSLLLPVLGTVVGAIVGGASGFAFGTISGYVTAIYSLGYPTQDFDLGDSIDFSDKEQSDSSIVLATLGGNSKGPDVKPALNLNEFAPVFIKEKILTNQERFSLENSIQLSIEKEHVFEI
ncbi:MAG: hypothetical protein H0U57_03070 [Tatlockia sp.]|nr:hypothetical protein [Tatlockia sp.]